MSQLIKIFLPIIPSGISEVSYTGKLITTDEDCLLILITTYLPSCNILPEGSLNEENVIYGYHSDQPPKNVLKKCLNSILLQNLKYPKICRLVFNGTKRINNDNCIIMFYDYHKIKSSETLSSNDCCLSILQGLIHKNTGELNNKTANKPNFHSPSLLESSMFGQHVYNYVYMIKWLLNTAWTKRKISIEHGNLMMAIFLDILLGYFILELIIFDKKELGTLLLGILEKLVNLMYSLLKWLMGAPAGLKLNNAFNKMLGKYFLYHVELWWIFLDVSGEKLDMILQVYQYLGYLGITFQAAIISDMICLATFHSYCIYVYAARLFNIQISGLIALLRLFVGRKYNPLRGGIDSCEYTNQELFVGTVAFTILLLLLPTTVMYYIVFTMFRVLSLSVQYILARMIYIIQSSPFYAAALWITRSRKIAGNILIEEIKCDSPLVLKIKLHNTPFGELVAQFTPPVKVPKHFEWSTIVSSVLTGKQII